MSTCAGRDDVFFGGGVVFTVCHASFAWMLASLGARLPSFSRDLSHRHAFLTHLCMFYLPVYVFYSSVLACLIECTVQLCVFALHGKRAVHIVVIHPFFPAVCSNLFRADCQTLHFHLLCRANSLYTLLSGVRKGNGGQYHYCSEGGVAVFFSGPETARYAR